MPSVLLRLRDILIGVLQCLGLLTGVSKKLDELARNNLVLGQKIDGLVGQVELLQSALDKIVASIGEDNGPDPNQAAFDEQEAKLHEQIEGLQGDLEAQKQ